MSTWGFQQIHPNPVERYFTKRYCTRRRGQHEGSSSSASCELCPLFYRHEHSNGIFMVGLAPSHPAVVSDVSIMRVTLSKDLESVGDLSKRKRGAPVTKANTVLCVVELENGERYEVPAGMPGDLVEINTALVKDASLIKVDPEGVGFIALIQAKLQRFKDGRQNTIPEEEYLRMSKSGDLQKMRDGVC